MSKEEKVTDMRVGMWIPESRVPDYEAKGYVISDPQPSLTDDQKRFRGDSIHMMKKAA